MIDKLEVGVKYKLVDKDGFFKSNEDNQKIFNKYKDKDGCLMVYSVSSDGSRGYSADLRHNILFSKELAFFEVYQSPTCTGELEYRVIRRANGHQVCDWRKGVALYEDGFGTLVRNDKRTKFYTDIVEWREVGELSDVTSSADIEFIIKSLSREQLSDLIIQAVDMAGLSLPKGNKL